MEGLAINIRGKRIDFGKSETLSAFRKVCKEIGMPEKFALMIAMKLFVQIYNPSYNKEQS